MKLLKILAIIIGAGILILIATGAYYGLFTKVVITEETVPAMTTIMARHTGAYSEVGSIVGQLYQDLEDSAGMVPAVGVGIYYDNPQDTPVDSLRSFVGAAITAEEQFIIVSHDLPYEVVSLPPMRAYVARFPYKGVPSLILAISKVYPKLHAYCNEKNFKINTPTFEIYDVTNEEIRMIVPLTLSEDEYKQWWSPLTDTATAGVNLLDSLPRAPDTAVIDTVK